MAQKTWYLRMAKEAECVPAEAVAQGHGPHIFSKVSVSRVLKTVTSPPTSSVLTSMLGCALCSAARHSGSRSLSCLWRDCARLIGLRPVARTTELSASATSEQPLSGSGYANCLAVRSTRQIDLGSQPAIMRTSSSGGSEVSRTPVSASAGASRGGTASLFWRRGMAIHPRRLSNATPACQLRPHLPCKGNGSSIPNLKLTIPELRS